MHAAAAQPDQLGDDRIDPFGEDDRGGVVLDRRVDRGAGGERRALFVELDPGGEGAHPSTAELTISTRRVISAA